MRRLRRTAVAKNGKTNVGEVTQVLGSVVDVQFPADAMPETYFALEIAMGGDKILTVEVQQHLGDHTVRCVAMGSTDGLARGAEVVNTGAPITVPVGPVTLGRIFNVLGKALDPGEPVVPEVMYPIHRAAPRFDEQ